MDDAVNILRQSPATRGNAGSPRDGTRRDAACVAFGNGELATALSALGPRRSRKTRTKEPILNDPILF